MRFLKFMVHRLPSLRVALLFVGLCFSLIFKVVAQGNSDSLRLRLSANQTDRDRALTLLRMGNKFARKLQVDSASLYLKRGLDMMADQPRDSMNIIGNVWYGAFLLSVERIPESIPYLKEVVYENKIVFPEKYRLFASLRLANAYQRTGKIKDGISILMQVEPIVRQNDDKTSLADIYFLLGTLYGMDGNHDKVLKYFQESYKFIPPTDQYRKAMVANSLGNMYVNGNKPADALPYLNLAYQSAIKLGVINNAYFTLNNIAVCYLKLKQYTRANSLIDTILDSQNKQIDNNVIVQAFSIKAQILESQGHLRQARNIIDSAIALYRSGGEVSVLSPLLSEKARFDSLLGNYKASLTALKEVQQIKDSIYSQDKVKVIEEMRVKFDTQKVEEKNSELTTTLETEAKLRYLYIILGVIIVSLAVVLLLIQRQRVNTAKQKQLLSLKEIERAEQEKSRAKQEKEEAIDLVKITEEKLELHIDLADAEKVARETKERELIAALTLSGHRKDLLGKVETVIREYPSLSRKLEDLLETLGDSKELDEAWESYKGKFLQLHPDFFDKLQEYGADLTPYDQRLVAYIKLGLSIKEVASLLSVTEPSIHNSRSRLKKKLLLDPSQDLTKFITNF